MDAEKNKLLEYMKLHYPQYKFNGDTAKIFYNNYQLHAIGQESTIWSRVLEGEICVISGSRIEIRFYHPYGDWYDSKGAIQVFLNNCNTPNRKPKLELRGKICAVNDIFVSGFSINSCALEDCIYNTAKYLEAVDKELVKEIYNH